MVGDPSRRHCASRIGRMRPQRRSRLRDVCRGPAGGRWGLGSSHSSIKYVASSEEYSPYLVPRSRYASHCFATGMSAMLPKRGIGRGPGGKDKRLRSRHNQVARHSAAAVTPMTPVAVFDELMVVGKSGLKTPRLDGHFTAHWWPVPAMMPASVRPIPKLSASAEDVGDSASSLQGERSGRGNALNKQDCRRHSQVHQRSAPIGRAPPPTARVSGIEVERSQTHQEKVGYQVLMNQVLRLI